MPRLRHFVLAGAGLLLTVPAGALELPQTEAGAVTNPPLNSSFLEIDDLTTNTVTAQSYPTVGASLVGATLNVSTSQFTVSIGAQDGPPQPGSGYDSSNSTLVTMTVPGQSGTVCGTNHGDPASAFVDQAAYDSASQPTTVGISFDIVCSQLNQEYVGTAAFNMSPTTPHQGYYLYGDDGSLASFGNDSYLNYLGDLSTVSLNGPVVGMATTSDDAGYWMVAADGGIFSYGDAGFYGSTGSIVLNEPIVGMAATPTGNGYWLVASDGGIFAYGDALFYGSTGSLHLNRPIVGMAVTPSGHGYWLVASDGGIFAYGDAQFYGSTGAIRLNQPIVGMAATPSGHGYWLVATDGGIFSYGDAAFHGSSGSLQLNQPIVGMSPTNDGGGYWLVAQDGGLFPYGDAPFLGGLGGLGFDNIVGMTK